MAEDFQLADLRSFAATVRAGSITRAATSLGLTQPAVSQRIQRLERAVGQPLLVREPRGTRPTQAGEKFLGYAERILALHDQARTSTDADRAEPTGRRAVGLLEDLALTTLPDVLADFASMHPGVDLELAIGSGRALRNLADRGRLDIVFGDPAFMAPATIRWRRQETLVWAAAATLDPRTDPVPLVLFSPPCQWRQPVLDALTTHGRSWRVAFQSTSVHAIQAAVSAGIGVAALLAPNVPPRATRLSTRDDLPIPPDVQLALSRRAGTENDPAIDSMQRLLTRALD